MIAMLPQDTRSRSSHTANSVTSSGDTKLMAFTSASGSRLTAPKLHSVEPSSRLARSSWLPGRAVRTRSSRRRGPSSTSINTMCTV
jgi:hypothetical protein